MEKQSFFRSLSGDDRYMIGNLFFLYLIQGIYVILIGSILPMIKEEYGLSYQIGGYLISAHSTGNIVAGLFAGFIPLLIGIKQSLMLLNLLPYIGFVITLVTGNPVALIIALLLTGLGRGSISNYNNQAVSTLSGGNSSPLNALHGFFAIGAVTAPLITLVCTRNGNAGWRLTVYIILALGAVSVVTSSFMKMDSVKYSRSEGPSDAFGFLREFPYWYSIGIMFLYQCIEASVMGWMVTYYEESGVLASDAAQLLTSLLWITILVGRFACSAIGGRTTSVRIIRVLSAGILVFLCIVLLAGRLPLMLIGTIGLGLSLSGMYGTTVSNAGDVFGRYPLAMGVFVTLSGFGSIITPSVIGTIAETSGIRNSMRVLLAPAVVLLILAVLNRGPAGTAKKEVKS
ncbi:MAG: MFS transporter [Lachnospiraceae bacterium]|nr:MFS transporter [Lachnospiraceae bacterium]